MPEPLKPGRDYTIDRSGRYVFTREFLLARGECCGSACRNCPYGSPTAPVNKKSDQNSKSECSGGFDAQEGDR